MVNKQKAMRLVSSVTLCVGLAMLLTPTPVTHAATYIVNTLADTDDGVCDATNCTLREAINAANITAGADTITFSVSGTKIGRAHV